MAPNNVICRVEALARRNSATSRNFYRQDGDPFGDNEQADYAPTDQRRRTGVDLTNSQHAARGQRALFELPGVFQGPLDPDQPDDQPNNHNNVAPPMANDNDDDGIEGDADNIGDMPEIQQPPPQLPPQVIDVDAQAIPDHPEPAPLEPLNIEPVDNNRPQCQRAQPIHFGYDKYNNAMLATPPPFLKSKVRKHTRSAALERMLREDIRSMREKLALKTLKEHEDGVTKDQWATVVHYVMTQYSFKTALKKFLGQAEKAVGKELLQVHTRNTFVPKHALELSPEQRLAALEAIMTVKHKRDDSVKGRLVADGRK